MTKRGQRKCLNCGGVGSPGPAQWAPSALLLGAAVPKGQQGGQSRRAGRKTPTPTRDRSHQETFAKTYNFKMANLVQFHAVASTRSDRT